MPFDRIDLEILKILQEDSRTPFTKIAEEVSKKLSGRNRLREEQKIPDTTIHFRVRKLKETGVIKRFTIDVSPKMLGFETIGILKISVGGHILKKISLSRAERISSQLSNSPNIVFVGIGGDRLTIYAVVVAKDRNQFLNLVEDLRKNPDIDLIDYNLLADIKKGEEVLKPLPVEVD
ncbi:MAG: winged helix-turn-helix transcriptional regulator [Candidatus Odinarchaeum yellowstonii]|uniref:Winged helix-turn-helix transcriptional regulator n=1 Tax=Odinarchaeota yellowstonii (strain LCB_4) TaxID=1841599 RepID=A0AAF0D310_ODILC|nr:MAG: winged helix-turn-helix transcriptional regulator [Candidatus Odinarchaeum yellowstonii]